ncbi:MAG: barstar family protein [Flavobacteriaceae bacterium]|jgi:ribonuclease inhibitor|nr:barstar family protein [Flavobacteriaceae bacterium]
MTTVVFDFNTIQTLPDFYKLFQKEFRLTPVVANNLDGLWDAITGIIKLPVRIEFQNLSLDKLNTFQNLISLFENAEKETDTELGFAYFVSK